jgi:hypothetical protein
VGGCWITVKLCGKMVAAWGFLLLLFFMVVEFYGKRVGVCGWGGRQQAGMSLGTPQMTLGTPRMTLEGR